MPRQRRRRAKDAETFHRAIECIACNLLAVSIAAPDQPLAVPLANSASRISSVFGKPARTALDLMIGLDLITKVRGYPFRGPSTIRATRKLAKYLPLGKIAWSALQIHDDPTVVILKRRGDSPNLDDVPASADLRVPTRGSARWLRSAETDMETINAVIKRASIECTGHAIFHVAERPTLPTASLVTLHHRSLRRIFNGNWEQGGRLFGGFWQTMPREDRFRDIRIGGEPVALIDYSQLFLRLAYGEAAVEPPSGDLYDVTGRDAARPDWKSLRNARKKLVNALLFRTYTLKQWPGDTFEERSEMRNAFPLGTKALDAIKAIKEKHKPIGDWFERGHGLRFMRRESDLIVAVTLDLFSRGVVALPIHDAVLVAAHHATTAKAVMESKAYELTGARISAEIQTG